MATTTTTKKRQQSKQQQQQPEKRQQSRQSQGSQQSQQRQQPPQAKGKQQEQQQAKPGPQAKQQKSEPAKQIPLVEQAQATLKRLEEKDPGLKQQLEKARGYAVFPSVGKASLVVGGSYGRGAVFERGKLIGYATISQLTLGVQLGGDTFSEVVLLHTPEALDRFKAGHMAFAANASAVLVKAGASGTNNFRGATALAYSRGGMLLELVIGGQKFRFKPLDESGGESSGGAEDQGAAGMVGRAVGGVRGAASKATDLAKEHPVMATVAGVSVAAGLALLVARSMRNAGVFSGGGGGGKASDGQAEDELQDQDDAGEAEDQDEDADEEQGEEEEDQPRFLRRGR